MKITDVIIENFMTIGKAHLSLDGKGLVLIQGENRDDSSADSNGAGKSTIPDSICWAAYGTTARGYTGDEVINVKAKKNTYVGFVVEDGPNVYKIERYRKHATEKNRLRVTVNHVDATKGTDKLTQEYVEELLGCSLQVFTAAIYAGQEAMPDLPAMTDKQLKLIVEEAAGTDKLQAGEVIAKELHLTAVREEADAQRAVDMASKAITDAVKLKEEYEQSAKDSDANRVSYVHAKTADFQVKKKEVEEQVKKLAEFDVAALQKQLTDVELNIASVEGEREKLDALQKAQSKAESDFKVAYSKIETTKRAIQKAKDNVLNIEHKVGQKCGECGKEHTEKDLENLTHIAKQSVVDLTLEARKQVEQVKELQKASALAAESVSAFKATMTDLSSSIALERDLRAQLKEASDIKSTIDKLKREAKAIVDEINAKKKEENPFAKLLTSTVKKIEEEQVNLKMAEEALATAAAKTALHKDAVEVFGKAGVRAHILDTVTPYLNARTGHYLSILSDGNITAEWNTLSTTGKGELREKFNISATNSLGASSFKGLSGGEKRKARLAAAMALQDMVANRATKPIELFIADEVDHALDESGLERFMSILNEKATERGTVLVISHNELGDWVRDQTTVIKEGGVSRVEGFLAV